jgi:hypothetical protein
LGNSLVFATIDGRLISLDKLSGRVNWDVLTIDKSKPYTITGAPRIIDGKIIIGMVAVSLESEVIFLLMIFRMVPCYGDFLLFQETLTNLLSQKL